MIAIHLKSLTDIIQPPGAASTYASPSKSKGKGKGRAQGSPLKESVAALEPIFLDGGEEAMGWKKGGTNRVEWENRERSVHSEFC